MCVAWLCMSCVCRQLGLGDDEDSRSRRHRLLADALLYMYAGIGETTTIRNDHLYR